jgi:hypothetical protein
MGMRLKQRVNEGGHSRSLRQHDERTKEEHHYNNREQPEFLALLHEGPQLEYEFTHGKISFLKLTGHMRAGTRLPDQTIRIGLWFPVTAHRVLPPQTHDESCRCKQPVKNHPENNPGVDPSQPFAKSHPHSIDGLETPGAYEGGKQEQPCQRYSPEPDVLVTYNGWPQANSGEDTTDGQAEGAQVLWLYGSMTHALSFS